MFEWEWIQKISRYQKCAAGWMLAFLLFAIASKLYHGPFEKFSAYYIGDVGIVASLYFMLSMVFPRMSRNMKWIAVFLFATAVEFYQYSGIPVSWNLTGPVVHVFGTSFDRNDFFAYIVGLVAAVGADWFFCHNRKNVEN